MGSPAAKQGDKVIATDTHLVVQPNTVVVPQPFPFLGKIDDHLSPNVRIEGKPAATVKSTATNQQRHFVPPNQHFQKQPNNQSEITSGSGKVRINNKAAARHGDRAKTCDDVNPAPHGVVSAVSRVRIG
jgi:uncharacterized Zn-binding protein involved in type VI secretion